MLSTYQLRHEIIRLAMEGFWRDSIMQKLGIPEDDSDIVEDILEDQGNYVPMERALQDDKPEESLPAFNY